MAAKKPAMPFDLMKLSIERFFLTNKRIPMMREAEPDVVRSALSLFKTWNKFVRKCGFKPNTKKSRKKTVCKDGHIVDSASEAILDNFFSDNSIQHQVHVRYPRGKMISDFYLTEFNVYVEFFGMASRKRYKQKMQRKRLFFEKCNLRVIEVLPDDLFTPGALENKFKEFTCKNVSNQCTESAEQTDKTNREESTPIAHS
jgi:hypothetical protein